MGQDREIGQGPPSELGGQGPLTELKEQERQEHERMLVRDHYVERQLVWKEVVAVVLALTIVVLCAWAGGRL